MTLSEQRNSSERRVGRRRDQKRRWDTENKPTCRCGGRMRRGAELCRACRDAVNAERVRERRKAIALYWGLGMTLREIGDALGTTKETVGAEIARMRKLGWDIPRRYTVRSRS